MSENTIPVALQDTPAAIKILMAEGLTEKHRVFLGNLLLELRDIDHRLSHEFHNPQENDTFPSSQLEE